MAKYNEWERGMNEMYESDSGEISIALAGDCIATRPLSVYREERFLGVREILRRADARFGNLETNIHRYLEGNHAQRPGGGTYLTTEPPIIEDLKWLGFNLLACGSSHADDYGWEGVLNTMRCLDEAGVSHAGSGRHLAEARSPGYLDTPRGRVGLVAATAQFNVGYRAGEQRRDTPGHPGVNGIRHRVSYVVDQETLNQVREIGRKIGLDAEEVRRRYQGDPGSGERPDAYNLLGHTFVLGSEFAVRTLGNASDIEENVRQVRLARAMADRVIVSLHCHEQGGSTLFTAERRSDVEDLADFAVDFAHRCIDAGADAFVAHGPQVALGVEIYKGRPIFYGLGIFIFQLETLRYLPAEAYERYGLGGDATPLEFIDARYAGDTRGHPADPLQWHQMFAVCDFAGDALREARLYPLELGYGRPRSQRGRPLMATNEAGEKIIQRVAELSARKYGTEIVYRDNVGVIRP